ncbi:hypothetical protein [Acidithiobacillus ferrooxidans]|uniref:Uncharacterized protein n=1 Tax=Acidithiobacillus ferrooxidans TaxID=920 RepID=A0A2W1KJB3_ACIFR|nr:hypothetical protein [Acidithiobacillus ferrooxidans]MBU2817609.1 hypothetical protein [Acidithiobacillus ferrooxidans]MCR1341889.1 hypothetical protein [Acidithiobacillus ferrooxidans]PZD81874.1 hypothetical protein DN052_02020 [Acidithiobacillus ferrooxidans]QLK41836.1 hypothetical protein FE661_06475 [Acidithiobacillus ferrooxidans]QZT53790.1 hypothetical protein K7B00_06440 [Acidithiobacillus ferrooxidans]
MSSNSSRVQEYRKRLAEKHGKVVTIHMSEESMADINGIIQLMSTKKDKLTVRDVVCFSVRDMAIHLSNYHDSTKAIYNSDKEQREKNRAKWRRFRKIWDEHLAKVRADYHHQLPRGRRPKDVKACE